MSGTKKLSEWEIEQGVLIGSVADINKSMTEEEFNALAQDRNNTTGVNHADRIAFLKANGYAVNRENMIKDLSSRK